MDVDTYRRSIPIVDAKSGEILNFSVIDAGPTDAARTMVFIHGFGGRAAYWEHQLDHFSVDSRVIALDLRGHGLTDAPNSQYDMDEHLSDVVQLLDAFLAPPSFTLIVHSFGGAVASYFLAKHPKRVDKLVIIASAAQFKLRWVGRALLRMPPWLLGAARRFTRVAKLYPPSHVVVAMNRNALAPWDGKPYLKQIQVPTLVILGQRDLLFSQESYHEVAAHIPGAQEVVIPVSAHQVMVERPDAVNRAIDRFLGSAMNPQAKEAKRQALKQLERDRPWLKFYDPRTPYRIKPPVQAVQRMMEIAAKRFADTAALIFHGQSMSYHNLDRQANRFASALVASGFQTGDRVGLLLPNSPQAMIGYYGILKAGGVVVFLNPLFSTRDLHHQIVRSGVNRIVALSLFAKALNEALLLGESETEPEPAQAHAVQSIILTRYGDYLKGAQGLAFEFWHSWVQGHRPRLKALCALQQLAQNWKTFMRKGQWRFNLPPPPPTALAVIQYTSGTTGATPQGVMLTHANLVANALQMRHWVPEARPADERILAALPFAHSYGLTSCLNFAPLVAGTLILLPSFAVPDVLQAVKLHKPTLFPGTPPMYRRLAETQGVRRYGLASIRICVSGGSPLPLEVQEAFEKVTRGRVIEGYGLTEASPLTHANPLGVRRRPGSIGIPISDTDAKIVDPETGRTLPDGEIGELWISGPQTMQGYWQDATTSALALCGEWLRTGDMAKRDEEGFFYIIDRKKDLILTGTLCVYPREIEEVLYEHPAVEEAAVAALPEANTPVRSITAFVVKNASETLTEAMLLDHCRQRLSPPQMPVQVVFLSELPRNFVGKVLRRQLKKPSEQIQNANVPKSPQGFEHYTMGQF